ncbi:hypothetical protein HPB49_011162 [Dermacentor silvarum]|uniref:Uncharacterized protein n=1 Tax=Dermacentor silvarum TaxID=543639 RepID=A0ACB8C8Z2_DERSI|nr:hypothetical protein HPB49_011162 [Dermacentor silvarum]
MESGPSPGEALQGRRLRTTLPDVRPCPGRSVQKHRPTDHSSQQLPSLNPRDMVRMKEGAWAAKGQVVQATTYPRSYNIITKDRTILRRNQRHLLPTREAFRQRGLCESEEDLRQGADERSSAYSSNDAAESPATTGGIPASFNAPAGLQQNQEPALRRSTRERRPPQRLTYDRSFVHVP